MGRKYQVAVVGGGPVGVGLAIELGMRGVSCVVIEPRTDLGKIPKGQNLTQRTLEHFANWGVEPQIREARLMPPGYAIGELTAYDNLLGEYWHAPSGRELVRQFYSQDNERLPQYQTEMVLRRRLAELPCVETRYGWRAGKLTQDSSGVRVEVSRLDGSQPEILECDYLVGCDGAHSGVREQIGIERTRQEYDKTMLLAVFRSKDLDEKLKRFPIRSTYRVLRPDLRGFWQFFGRIDVPDGWFFHAPVPGDAKIETFDSLGLIRQAAGFDCSCDFEYLAFWNMRVAVATEYRRGRVFIAGDAAHSHPPYGGFGLNNGLEDVVNLGWKLAARLQGWGTDALLDTYGDERRPVFWETADDFITSRIQRDDEFLQRYNPAKDKAEFEAAWKGRETDIGSRFQQYEPNYEGSPAVFGPMGGVNSAHGVHQVKARPGHHLAPLRLSDGLNTFESLGRDFTLLAFGASEADVRAIEIAAAAHDVPLKLIRDTRDSGREAYEAKLVLVRPDQYVVWAGDRVGADAASIVRRVTGR